MNPIDLVASMVSSNVEQAPDQLLFEFVNNRPRFRVNEFVRFCQSRGVEIFAEEVINIIAHDTNYLFVEGQDNKGRYWDIQLYEGYVPHGMQAGPDTPGGSMVPRPYDDEQGDLAGVSDFPRRGRITGENYDEVGQLEGDDLADEIAGMMPEAGDTGLYE